VGAGGVGATGAMSGLAGFEGPPERVLRSCETMCGIAGYSLNPESHVDRTLAAQALLAGIAERGADAAGYAWRDGSGTARVRKQQSGASALLEEIRLRSTAAEVLVHVRDYTKGHPTIAANNHPIRHGAVVGIHNGIIVNDDEIMAAHGFARAEPGMTVDSEAIFALAEQAGSDAAALAELRGSMAAAWVDERRPGVVYLARGILRPLWLGRGRHEVAFASTREALEVLEAAVRVNLTKREVGEGTLLTLAGGRVASSARFSPDRSFVETPLPSVRAPHEGAFCLQRLAAIVAAL
jgi:glucosamine 6-phosphate synthetase-like amidotransferase/phosphosugar isomerase protein